MEKKKKIKEIAGEKKDNEKGAQGSPVKQGNLKKTKSLKKTNKEKEPSASSKAADVKNPQTAIRSNSETGPGYPGKRGNLKKTKSNKKKILWITIPSVLFVLITGAVLGWYYYFIYYLKPNFSEAQYQNIASSKSGDVKPGEEITYTINLKNTGNTTVSDMAISTTMPQNCKLTASQPEAKLDSKTGIITFNIASIPKDTAESASYTIKIDSPLDNGIVLKTGKVLFSYDVRDESLDFEIPDIFENIVVSSPDFSGFDFTLVDVNKGDFNIKDVVEFNLAINNNGDMDAKNIDIVTMLPEKFELFESSIRFPGSIDSEKNTVTWNLKELSVGKSRAVKFKAGISTEFEHLEIFNGASSVIYDGKIVKEEVFEGEVYGYPNFSESSYSVADVNGGSVWAGDVLRYTIVVKNTGFRAGKDFKLMCPIPSSTSLISDSIKPAQGFEYDSSAKAVVWTIDNIDIGEEKVFEFSVAISEALTGGGAIRSAFLIEGDEQFVELPEKTIGVRKYIYHTVVCMGDSLLAYTNWAARLDGMLEGTYPRAEYNTIAVGVPGQMSHQAYHKFDATVAPHGPQIIVFGFGSNDVGTSVNAFISGMTGLINKGKGMGATVIVHSIGYIDTGRWPSKSDYTAYNNALRSLCANMGVPYVDIYTPLASNPGKYISDGLHLTSEGASLVANLVFNTMRNYLDADGGRK